MTFKELKEKYKVKSVDDEWFLLNPNDAVEMIKEGASEGLKFLSADAFIKTPEGAFEDSQKYGTHQFSESHKENYLDKSIKYLEGMKDKKNILYEVWMS